MIKVGDIVRLASHRHHNNWKRNIGIVIGVQSNPRSPWHQVEQRATIQWVGGSQTITGLHMLERVEQ
jgi:hypothetical protein